MGYKDIQTKFESYLSSNFDDIEILKKFINTCDVEPQSKNLIKKLDNIRYQYIRFEQTVFKKRTEIFIKESAEIFKRTKANNIRILFVKGLCIVLDLYENLEDRRFDDIDIIIDYADRNAVSDIFLDMGYTIEENSVDIREAHTVFYKYVDGMFINIEMHCDAFYPPDTYLGFGKDMIKRSCVKNFSGIEMPVPEMYDAVIYYLIHSTKHFIAGFNAFRFGNALHNCLPKIPLKNLFDIALYLDKYADIFDWQIFLERVRLMKADTDILLALKYFEEIFPDMLPISIADELISDSLTSQIYKVSGLVDMFLNNRFSNVIKAFYNGTLSALIRKYMDFAQADRMTKLYCHAHPESRIETYSFGGFETKLTVTYYCDESAVYFNFEISSSENDNIMIDDLSIKIRNEPNSDCYILNDHRIEGVKQKSYFREMAWEHMFINCLLQYSVPIYFDITFIDIKTGEKWITMSNGMDNLYLEYPVDGKLFIVDDYFYNFVFDRNLVPVWANEILSAMYSNLS
ncbi:MAG: nucleotidyltransferase family protein [Clostridiales bacterium]|jgi:hypothetical protein|nr:nucleotidyltransferase family protein [Clostridiales bacterium]